MTEKIYETTKSMIEKHKKSSLSFVEQLRDKSEEMTKLRKGIRRHCVRDCGQCKYFVTDYTFNFHGLGVRLTFVR